MVILTLKIYEFNQLITSSSRSLAPHHQDAMCVARNIVLEPMLVPGGGAAEMHAAAAITKLSKSVEGTSQVR